MGLIQKIKVRKSIKRYYDLRYSISEFILDMLSLENMNKGELAEKMGKSPSEVTKLLSINHNLTLKSLSKLEEALGVNIVSVNSPIEEYFNFKSPIRYIIGESELLRSKQELKKIETRQEYLDRVNDMAYFIVKDKRHKRYIIKGQDVEDAITE